MSESELEQEWIAGGAHESFVSWLCDNLIEARSDGEVIKAMRVAVDNLTNTIIAIDHKRNAAIQRGDTYRARALKIMQSARLDRRAAVIALHQDRQIIDALQAECNRLQLKLKQANRPNLSLDEALNSGDGVYRP